MLEDDYSDGRACQRPSFHFVEQRFGSRRNQYPLNFGWELDQHEMADVIEIIFSTFIYNPKKIVFGSLFVWNNLVNPSRNQRGFVISIVNTQSKITFRSIHHPTAIVSMFSIWLMISNFTITV